MLTKSLSRLTPSPRAPAADSPRRKAPRSAFTLVEVLVVLSIVAILAAILFPVFAVARENARRTACVSNLKHLGLAMRMFESDKGVFPHGGWTYRNQPTYFSKVDNNYLTLEGVHEDGAPGGGVPGGDSLPQFAGWGFQILPYLNAQKVYESGAQKSIASQNNIFFCPSRRHLDNQRSFFVNNFTANNAAEGQLRMPGNTIQIGATDYASAYAGKYSRGLFPKDPDGPDPETSGVIVRARLVPGPFYPRQAAGVNEAALVDGASNTILLGEKLMNLDRLGQEQLDDDQGYTAGWDVDVNRSTSFLPEQDYHGPAVSLQEFNSADRTPRVEKLYKFGSSHVKVANFLLADGSVRSISFLIDPNIFKSLGGIADGGPLSDAGWKTTTK